MDGHFITKFFNLYYWQLLFLNLPLNLPFSLVIVSYILNEYKFWNLFIAYKFYRQIGFTMNKNFHPCLEVGYTPGHSLLSFVLNFEWKQINSMAYLPNYQHDYYQRDHSPYRKLWTKKISIMFENSTNLNHHSLNTHQLKDYLHFLNIIINS